MLPQLRPLFIGSILGGVVALVLGGYLYFQYHDVLPDYLCIASRQQVNDEGEALQGSPTIALNWTVQSTPHRLEKTALIELTDAAGKPVEGAEIEVGFDMPSMPMMHAIPNAIAEPGEQPGQYKIRFRLEMAGVWAAKITVKRPNPFSIMRRFKVE